MAKSGIRWSRLGGLVGAEAQPFGGPTDHCVALFGTRIGTGRLSTGWDGTGSRRSPVAGEPHETLHFSARWDGPGWREAHFVGDSCTPPNGQQHAFLWDSANGMRDLNNLVSLPAGDVLIIAFGINDGGSIVGAGTFNGHLHAFLLDPMPMFAGTPGKANCFGQSVSALASQFGGLNAAAAALGYSDVSTLQNAVLTFCGG